MKHILLAEDDDVTSYLLTNMLESAGYTVTAAKDGKAALDILLNLNQSVDLLLTDIQMPYLSGMELIDQLQSHKIKIPILVMTGFGDKETVVQLLRKGCRDYIDKPFIKQDLLDRVNEIFKAVPDHQNQEDRQDETLYKEKVDLHREIETYRISYENLRSQMDSALAAYHELVHPYHKDFRIPVCIRSAPFSELGGDFFDIRDTQNGCNIFIADVAGHDMGASYHTILMKAFLNECHRKNVDGESFFNRLNRRLLENSSEERMVTAVYFSLNLETMQGEIINAAHPPVIRISRNKIEPLNNVHQNTFLGIFEDALFQKDCFQIHPGDKFFLHTDGLTGVSRIDQETGNRMLLNDSGLIQLLKSCQQMSIHDMIETIWRHIQSYKFNDDILFFGLDVLSGLEKTKEE